MSDSSNIIVNRVAESGIITINLEEFYPTEEFEVFDLKDYLFKELILKEKDFRAALKEYDWEALKGKILLVHCSSDAIIPVWSYMLVSAYATPNAKMIWQGTKEEFLKFHYAEKIEQIKGEDYEQKRVVIKGCSEKDVPPFAYALMVKKLQPHVQSVMYGEFLLPNLYFFHF